MDSIWIPVMESIVLCAYPLEHPFSFFTRDSVLNPYVAHHGHLDESYTHPSTRLPNLP